MFKLCHSNVSKHLIGQMHTIRIGTFCILIPIIIILIVKINKIFFLKKTGIFKNSLLLFGIFLIQ